MSVRRRGTAFATVASVMKIVRGIVLVALVLGLAPAAQGQDDEGSPLPRENRPSTLEELQKEWTRANVAYGAAARSVLSLMEKLAAIDVQLAPHYKEIAELEKQPPGFARDRALARAYQRLREEIDKSGREQLRAALVRAQTTRTVTRERVIEVGWDYVPRLFQSAERDRDNKRDQQADRKFLDAFEVIESIGTIEREAPPAEIKMPEFGPAPEGMEQRVALAQLYSELSQQDTNQGAKLSSQHKKLKEQETRLASIIAKGYDTDGRVQNMLKVLKARLENLLERIRLYEKRADLYGKKAKELESRKNENNNHEQGERSDDVRRGFATPNV